MLHLLLGPSGSGKSRRMLAELRTRRRARPAQSADCAGTVHTPPPRDSSTARWGIRLVRLRGKAYSFTSLAETLLRRYGGAAVQTLDEAGRALLVRRAVDSLLDRVVYYNRQRRSAAFCEKAGPDHRGTEKCRGHAPGAGRLCPGTGGGPGQTAGTFPHLWRLRRAAGPDGDGSRRPAAAGCPLPGCRFLCRAGGLHR